MAHSAWVPQVCSHYPHFLSVGCAVRYTFYAVSIVPFSVSRCVTTFTAPCRQDWRSDQTKSKKLVPTGAEGTQNAQPKKEKRQQGHVTSLLDQIALFKTVMQKGETSFLSFVNQSQLQVTGKPMLASCQKGCSGRQNCLKTDKFSAFNQEPRIQPCVAALLVEMILKPLLILKF